MHWNYRRIEHRDSSNHDHEVYYTVHETYYGLEEDDTGRGYVARPASPKSKEDWEHIGLAFDKPPVAWVDDATHRLDENGFEEYESWGWLEGE